jgi:hypothetical protein
MDKWIDTRDCRIPFRNHKDSVMPALRSKFRQRCLLPIALACVPVVYASAPTTPSPDIAPKTVSLNNERIPVVSPERAQHATTLARELVFGAGNGMYLGINSLLVPWGNSITLPSSEATSKSNGLCTFRSQFYVRNAGFLTSIPTQNTVRLNSSSGPLLSSLAMSAIPYLAQFNNSTDIVLAPGTYVLYAKIDEPNTNAEFYENNNLNRVQVNVSGSCN